MSVGSKRAPSPADSYWMGVIEEILSVRSALDRVHIWPDQRTLLLHNAREFLLSFIHSNFALLMSIPVVDELDVQNVPGVLRSLRTCIDMLEERWVVTPEGTDASRRDP